MFNSFEKLQRLQIADEIRGTSSGVKLGAHVAVAVMTRIGLFFVSGVLKGIGGGCGLSVFFGSCQDKHKLIDNNAFRKMKIATFFP